MQNLNMNENQILLLMQLAKLMPTLPVHQVYQNANALMAGAFRKSHQNFPLNGISNTLNHLVDLSIARKEKFGLKLEDETIHFDGKSSIETCLPTSEANPHTSTTSPNTFNMMTEKIEQTGKTEGMTTIKCEETSVLSKCDIKDTIKLEEQDGLLKQSKKIVKEKVNCKPLVNGVEKSLAKEKLSQSVRKENIEKIEKRKGKKEHWKPEEDEKLAELYEIHGPKWSHIAELMGDKRGKQVRDRYINFLKPGIRCEKWTKEEEDQLEDLVEKYGRKWCQIASNLEGRTENQVKNKYYCIINKKSRNSQKSTKKVKEHIAPLKAKLKNDISQKMTGNENEEKVAQESPKINEPRFKPIPLQLQAESLQNIPLPMQLVAQTGGDFLSKHFTNNPLKQFLTLVQQPRVSKPA